MLNTTTECNGGKGEAVPLVASPTKALLRTYDATLLSNNKNVQEKPSNHSGSNRGLKRLNSRESGGAMVDDEHKTTDFETVLHLLKGYLGAGCLSLPYAVSQLGITWGVISIFALSYWTSANCYTVVNIRRHMEKTSLPLVATNTNNTKSGGDDNNYNDNDSVSETSSNITYPDVGNWAYGGYFEKYVSACIILLQGAVCTVYVSFIGENLLAVFHYFGITWITHSLVMTFALPLILALNFIPSLKLLAPVMAVATILLIVTLASLGVIVTQEWSNRPEATPEIQPSKIPAALCMILYSYEGINLILPVQAAMKSPSHFDFVFWLSMAIVALCLAGVAVICVLAFGNVTNGSVTAFLLEKYQNDSDDSFTAWIMFVNTTVSLSVLLTYPLTMYPAVELMGPILQRSAFLALMSGTKPTNLDDDDDDFRDPLEAFEPLPPLPEHDPVPEDEHQYEGGLMIDSILSSSNRLNINAKSDDIETTSAISQSTNLWNMQFTLPGDSPQLRASLVLITYLIAVSVPNVQTLISLVGALAGSSAALLIPPVLELAWVEHIEHIDQESTKPIVAGTPPPPSPHLLRKLKRRKQLEWWNGGTYWKTKVKCYLSFALGFVFLAVGTTFSVLDIVDIYMKK